MRIIASWFGSLAHRIQGRGTNTSCATRGLPSYRHPDTAKCAGVLGAVQGQAFGGREDAASLDRPCARQRIDMWVGTKKRLPGRTKKLSDEKLDRTLVAPLDKNLPIQG
jgi:hypothetical protein